MQAIFADNEALANALSSTISKPRIKRYLTAANNSRIGALQLYHWNTQLSQAMYLPVQIWEVTLRNRLNTILQRRFGEDWPFDEVVALRQFTDRDAEKVREAIKRQRKNRRMRFPPTGAIVADLSAGLWVSLLSDSYDVPLGWHNLIGRVFAYDATIDRSTAHTFCTRLLDIRNRIAHHEAIYHLPLAERRADAERLIAGMCRGSQLYLAGKCELELALAARPEII